VIPEWLQFVGAVVVTAVILAMVLYGYAFKERP
jgi:hypothetical protein